MNHDVMTIKISYEFLRRRMKNKAEHFSLRRKLERLEELIPRLFICSAAMISALPHEMNPDFCFFDVLPHVFLIPLYFCLSVRANAVGGLWVYQSNERARNT